MLASLAELGAAYWPVWHVAQPLQSALRLGRLQVVHLRHLVQVISGRLLVKLLPAPDYAIRVIAPTAPDAPPTSEIIVAGTPTGKVIGGAVLRAALKWNEYALLFLTDDVPFEDTLSIYLIDAELNVVDAAHMYFIYATGIFSDLDLTQDDTVRFRFFAGIAWTLKLLPKKTFVLPIISDPRGVSRPFAFFRMFQIYRDTSSETLPAENINPPRRSHAGRRLPRKHNDVSNSCPHYCIR